MIPCIPGIVLPRAMQKQFTEDGNPKAPRCTVNPGDTHPLLGSNSGGVRHEYSINDCTDLDDEKLFPLVDGAKMRYLRVTDLAKQAAILMTMGEPLGQAKDDLTGYYPQLPRPGHEQHRTMQWLMSEGMQIARRLLFGLRAEPSTTNRIAFLLVWLIRRELDKRQSRMEREGVLPAHVMEWIRHRRAIGQSGSLAVLGQFFDDLIAVFMEGFGDEVQAGSHTVWSAYNIDVADGHIHPVTHKPTKDKSERADAATEMSSLGLCMDLSPPGRTTYGEVKKKKYAAKGRELIATAEEEERHDPANRLRMQRKGFRSWSGQLGFLSQVSNVVYNDLQVLRSRVPADWGDHSSFPITADTLGLMDAMCDDLDNNQGIAFFRDDSPPGALRPLVWTFTDASRRPEAEVEEFVGFGGWVWCPDFDPLSVFYFSAPWTHHEQTQLDSTDLELHTKTIALQLLERTGWVDTVRPVPGQITDVIPVDVVQVGDNSAASGASGVANSGHGKSASLRALLHSRSAWLQSQSMRTFSAHVVREYNEEADHLANGRVLEAHAGINKIFGRQMAFVNLLGDDGASIPHEMRSLEPALLAKKRWKRAQRKPSRKRRRPK